MDTSELLNLHKDSSCGKIAGGVILRLCEPEAGHESFCVMCAADAVHAGRVSSIPPTAVGGLFRSHLHVSIVPDHVHMLVGIVPKMSIEECALILMNNGQHFMGKNYPQLLVEGGLNQLWEASAYAGTCGRLTTALLKNWLRTE